MLLSASPSFKDLSKTTYHNQWCAARYGYQYSISIVERASASASSQRGIKRHLKCLGCLQRSVSAISAEQWQALSRSTHDTSPVTHSRRGSMEVPSGSFACTWNEPFYARSSKHRTHLFDIIHAQHGSDGDPHRRVGDMAPRAKTATKLMDDGSQGGVMLAAGKCYKA